MSEPKENYIVEYRGEFSTVIEADSEADAVDRVIENSDRQWECVGELHSEFLECNIEETKYEQQEEPN